MGSNAARAEATGAIPETGAWPRYRDNLARHLIGISRDFQSRLRQSLSDECGFGDLRLSFGPLISMIWSEGRPLNELAEALGISSQAASQLANLVEEAGYLERCPNPRDRRSKLLTLTPRGQELVAEGIRIIRETDCEYAALAGTAPYRAFTAALVELFQGLGLQTNGEPALPDHASGSIAVLTLLTERVQRDLMEATAARGHRGLKMSHGQVLPLIGPEGGRIHEMARIQRVSRQAISTTTRDLESLGYLAREPDPRDRRGVVLTLTSRGVSLIEDAVCALDDLERDFLEILGEKRLTDLRHVARDLYYALDLEAGVFEGGAESRAPVRAGKSVLGRRSGREIEELAERLQRWLGNEDAGRLAAVLEPRARRSMV
ncbi:MAG: MarR family transcriptional regulator [Deltaproteobacteria bacterium]|jgi:DNA-binding MarR family transcriptional regulator|nr:MarR family transcriptional regulator [Deltaproteobacteria bacterium]MBW2501019.1 MarR family transcriptional regulator [Deltaproteobacteria bacterium]